MVLVEDKRCKGPEKFWAHHVSSSNTAKIN